MKKKKTNIHPCFHLKHPTHDVICRKSWLSMIFLLDSKMWWNQCVCTAMSQGNSSSSAWLSCEPDEWKDYGVRDVPHRAREFIGENCETSWNSLNFMPICGLFPPIHWVAYTISSSRINPEFVNWLGTWWVPFVAEFSGRRAIPLNGLTNAFWNIYILISISDWIIFYIVCIVSFFGSRFTEISLCCDYAG